MTDATKVFVHGNPETDAIWGPLTTDLAARGVANIARLSPPGFGAPSPAGWDALPSSYVKWLADELHAIVSASGSPVDLVGHDWGAGHVIGLAASRPDLIRSYATDCAGLVNPEYVWHDMAQVWQTEGDGEAAIQAMVDLPQADTAAMLQELGLTPEIAEHVAGAINADMASCVLRLYRAAVPPMLSDLADRLAAAEARPWLIIDAKDDPYVPSGLVDAVQSRFGAARAELPGQGHWWMMEPGVAATALTEFWNRLDG